MSGGCRAELSKHSVQSLASSRRNNTAGDRNGFQQSMDRLQEETALKQEDVLYRSCPSLSPTLLACTMFFRRTTAMSRKSCVDC